MVNLRISSTPVGPSMTDAIKTDESAGISESDRRAKRRARLRMLRGQLAEGPAQGAPTAERQVSMAPMRLDRPGRGPAARPAGGADLEVSNSQLQRRALTRAFRILTETPADESGLVEGTPFTQSGVNRLLETLRSRADVEGAAGAKVATRILQFLTSDEGDGKAEEVSVDRLQRIAQLAQNFGLGGQGRF